MAEQKLYQKCMKYQQTQLAPPPDSLVRDWGQQLGLSGAQAADISSRLSLRHIAGTYL